MSYTAADSADHARRSQGGRIGEYLAAFLLESHGIDTAFVDRTGSDLWCRLGSQMRAVEVKTAFRPEKGRPDRASFRAEAHKDADLFALLYIPAHALLLLRREDMGRNQRVPLVEFTEANMARTIREAFYATH